MNESFAFSFLLAGLLLAAFFSTMGCNRSPCEGVFLAERIFGVTIGNGGGREVPVRYIGEQHVREDLGCIPSFQDWADNLKLQPWMYGQRLTRTTEL